MIRGRFVIKNLEDVVIGIAEFENKIAEFVEAGGKRPDDQEMKSDLNFILPHKLSELLCLKQPDPKMTYDSFRQFVVGQVAQILMNSGRFPANAVGDLETDNHEDGNDEEEPIDPRTMSHGELIAAIDHRNRT